MLLPNEKLAMISKRFPDLWKTIDTFRMSLEVHGETWDPHVFIPLNDLIKLSTSFFPKDSTPEMDAEMITDISSLAAWRPTQDIIRFDPDLYNSLIKTSLTGKIPSEVFEHLPAWGIYIESPGLRLWDLNFEGFFVNLETCNIPDLLIMHFNFLEADLGSVNFMFPLGNCTIPNSLLQSREEAKKVLGLSHLKVRDVNLPKLEPGLFQVINLVLYVCSTGFSSKSAYNLRSSIGSYTAKKVKGIWRFFPPDKPRIRHVGDDFGNLIRKHREAVREIVDRAHPSPHLRRAHWHTYWKGPIKKKSDQPRVAQVRWLPPIPVGRIDLDGDGEDGGES